MTEELVPRTALDRGPPGEEPLSLDPVEREFLPEAGGDSSAEDIDSNIGGAFASAGLDSGGAVGVRRGMVVGRPGFEYDDAPHGEVSSDVAPPDLSLEDVAEVPPWADPRRAREE